MILSETSNIHQSKLDELEVIQIRNRICAIIIIASKCNQPVTYGEIALMLPSTREAINTEEFIKSDPSTLKQITVQNGFIVLKGYEQLFQVRAHNKQVSIEKMQTAKVFADYLLNGKSYLKILAVCGSVAYGSADEDDDIDLFIVAEKDRMWIAFARALIRARIMNTTGLLLGKHVDFCLSYVQDEKNFEKEISDRKNLLFAREFLSVKLLRGQEYYYALLDKAGWIRECLPALYRLKQLKNNESASPDEAYSSSTLLSIVNMVMYVSLGSYLTFKAFLRNLTFRKNGELSEVFEAKISKGSCLYNSKRYQELERIYSLM